jgi:hypothetical protein
MLLEKLAFYTAKKLKYIYIYFFFSVKKKSLFSRLPQIKTGFTLFSCTLSLIFTVKEHNYTQFEPLLQDVRCIFSTIWTCKLMDKERPLIKKNIPKLILYIYIPLSYI